MLIRNAVENLSNRTCYVKLFNLKRGLLLLPVLLTALSLPLVATPLDAINTENFEWVLTSPACPGAEPSIQITHNCAYLHLGIQVSVQATSEQGSFRILIENFTPSQEIPDGEIARVELSCPLSPDVETYSIQAGGGAVIVVLLDD